MMVSNVFHKYLTQILKCPRDQGSLLDNQKQSNANELAAFVNLQPLVLHPSEPTKDNVLHGLANYDSY